MNSIFLASLERCTSWQTAGGKSKAAFFKTANDKIILKQLTKGWTTEKAALLKFAPQYLKYVSTTSPSMLAKIFGVYLITIKGQTEYSIDLTLMEHLFCGLSVSTKFDLKGAPNRVSQCPETLLDTDWAMGNFSKQFPLGYASKYLLAESIRNDTKFLASQNIMDYSLLVGAVSSTSTLVAGIVDYIGTCG